MSASTLAPRNIPRQLASLAAFTLLLALAPAAQPQAGGINQGGPGYLHQDPSPSPVPRNASSAEAIRLEAMRQADRRKHLADDAARLLALSMELKSEIDRAPKDQLSLDTLRKAEESEKVARDLKKWLKS